MLTTTNIDFYEKKSVGHKERKILMFVHYNENFNIPSSNYYNGNFGLRVYFMNEKVNRIISIRKFSIINQIAFHSHRHF